LHQWLARILCDDGSVYDLEDRALAFEVSAREALVPVWPDDTVAPAPVAVAGPVDRTFLYRQILAAQNPEPRRAAFADLLQQQYRRHWAWVRERVDGAAATADNAGLTSALGQFLGHLDEVVPLDLGTAGGGRQMAELRAQLEQSRADTERLREYMEAARDRAEVAHGRARELEEEMHGLRGALGREEETRDKLRAERTRRIKAEREAAGSGQQLERLRTEYVKLDRRLHEMAGRLATGEGGQGKVVVQLGDLRNLRPEQVLGVGRERSEDELAQVRRRFAAAFHSDRAGQLPGWVKDLFDQVLGLVNSACDRLGGPGR